MVVKEGKAEAMRINFAAKRLVITVLPKDPNEWPNFIDEIGVTKR